jgi:undecaprenyl-diphosphatase
MDLFAAIILGFVQGLTEFLPVSSTGHLILVSTWLGLGENEAEKAFNVVVQGGTVLAVIWNYRKLLIEKTSPLIKREPGALRFWLMLFVAFLPAAIVGLFLHQKIKDHLFGVQPVLWALLVGGVVMIVVERIYKKKQTDTVHDWSKFGFKRALGVGLVQCFALWPGTSRSMSTILGGRLMGLSGVQAAEFSFLLAIPTLSAATIFDLYKSWDVFAASNMWLMLAAGFLTAYIVALFVIRGFLAFLKKYGLEPFGWYRIVVAIALFYFL